MNTNIIPKPYSITQEEGVLKTAGKTFFSDYPVPEFLKDILLKEGYKFSESTHTETNIKITTLISNEKSEINGFNLENDESYILSVSSKEIKITSPSSRGAFYGFVSLTQLLMGNQDEIPCVTICDKPEYSWRGFLLDTCRHFFTTDFIKKILDQCAFHKMNVFHWHLTDDQGWRLPVDGYPLLTEKGSVRQAHTMPASTEGTYEGFADMKMYYSHEEIREIVKYAEERKITIVPEVEFPGHSSALLEAYPEYGCTGGPYKVENRWGIFPDVLCLGKDKIFDLFDDILSTVEKLFPGKYIHIGGDECLSERWENCPDCQRRMKELNLDNASQLQSWATNKMLGIVQKHNRIPIGWDEVLENNEKFPAGEDLIVQSWRGFEGGEEAVRTNHKVIMSPQTHCYLNLKNKTSYEEPGRLGTITLEKAYSFVPFTDEMSQDKRRLILGGECTFWSEYITASRITEYLMFPRFCAMAECFWLPENKKSFGEFVTSLDSHLERLSKMDVTFYRGDYNENMSS
ncbi:MAG: beta-N-acetylhexosaminidase [Treponema sp.]|nr:beta-N-acetylhexosaminidase [Treponema sp.]